MSKTSLRTRMWAYCAASFGFTLLSSTFSFYYVKVFLTFYHIDEKWFHLAQILYLIWNAVNDPLFAYCQDTSASWMPTTRRELILYTGPLFGMAYLTAWFPWAYSSWVTGLHLIVALCLYDTMFTFIGLALCCLYTEITVTESERIRLTQMSQVVGFIGSFSVTLCEFSSHSLKDFSKFQATTVLLAVLSAVFMVYAGKHAHTYYDVRKMMATNEGENEDGCTQSTDRTSYWRLTWQILSDRNFLSFVITNFFQEFHRSFIMSFTVIICDQLISEDDVHPYVRSIFYGSIPAIHSLLVIFGAPLVDKLGYFSVIRGNFVWKILSGLTMVFLGQGHPWLLIMFLLADSAYTNMAFSFFNLPLSYIADANMQRFNRNHPMSSMIFGTNALVVKPAQSLCPMFIVAVLNMYGYQHLKAGTLTSFETSQLKEVMFRLACCLPVVMGCLQFLSWSFFSIRLRHAPSHTIDVTA
ncbi:transmembrane protein 180-like [Haliotis asinina]|uniref:transmembrane protein 180-like n=1 Tax=Haliotis asinina TaxID=109174 RepID=UPI003531FD9C